MPGAAGMERPFFLGAAHDDFVEDAVIGPGEDGDLAAASDGAGHAHGAHDGFGAGVAQRGAVGAGELADEFGHFAGQGVLGADVVAVVELFAHGIDDEGRLPAEQAHAEAAEGVDILVAVQIPHMATGGAGNDDLINDFLELGTKAVDHARVSQMRAMACGVGLGDLGAFDVAAHEGVEPRLLPRAECASGRGVDAGDGAEGLFDVVLGVGGRAFVIGRRGACRSWGGWGCGCLRLRAGCGGLSRLRDGGGGQHLGRHLRGQGCGRTAQQGELLRHQLHLLGDELLHEGRVCRCGR